MQSIRNTCAALLIATLLAPGVFLGIAPPKQANAQAAEIIGSIAGAGVSYALCEYGEEIRDFFGDMFGGVLGAIFGGGSEDPNSNDSTQDSVPVNETNTQLKQNLGKIRTNYEMEVYKECILDPIAWVLKAILVNTVEQDILDWIDTGFEGGPVFLRDPVEYAKAISREMFERFLDESGVDAQICSSFGGDYTIVERVRDLSTQSTYGNLGSASCSVATAAYNRMVGQGSVETDGIAGAMTLVEEGNNPYSAHFNLQEEAARRSNEVVAREMTLADYGDGYFSMRCGYNLEEGVCTPGQLISKQVDDWLGGALGQMEKADEVSEVVSNVIANLVLTIFNDDTRGLLGGRNDRLDDDAWNFLDNEDGYTNPINGGGGTGVQYGFDHYNPVAFAGGDSLALVLCPNSPPMRSCGVNGSGMKYHGEDEGRDVWAIYGVSGVGGTVSCTTEDGSYFIWEVNGGTEMTYGTCDPAAEATTDNYFDASSVVVSYTDPDTEETWVSNGDNGFLNTRTGQEIVESGDGGDDMDATAGGYVDSTTGLSVSVPDDVATALENVDWAATAFTLAHIATYYTSLPAWAVTVAELGYTVATDWDGFVNAFNSAQMVGAPGTNLAPDISNPGAWTNPDTGEKWGTEEDDPGYGSGWTDPDTGQPWGPDDFSEGWTNPDTGAPWGPEDVAGWTNPDTGEKFATDDEGGGGGDDGGGDDGGGGFGCFLAGTNVTMADGTVQPIDQIKQGDYVLSYNNATQSFEKKEVLLLYEHPYEGDYLIINDELHVTPNHITYINHDWKRIDSAHVGDRLLLSTGTDAYIENIEYSHTNKSVYNLEVADTHTYFAEGYLVHNIK